MASLLSEHLLRVGAAAEHRGKMPVPVSQQPNAAGAVRTPPQQPRSPRTPCQRPKFAFPPAIQVPPTVAADSGQRAASPLLAEAHHHVDEAAVVLEALHGAALGLQGRVRSEGDFF